MPSTFTSASPARPTARNASRNRRRTAGDGCGHELDFWFKESTLHPVAAADPAEAEAAADARRPAGGVQTGRGGAVSHRDAVDARGAVISRHRPTLAHEHTSSEDDLAATSAAMTIQTRRAEHRALHGGGDVGERERATDDRRGEVQRFPLRRFHQPRQAEPQHIGAVEAGEHEEAQSGQQQKNPGEPDRREGIDRKLERAVEIAPAAEQRRQQVDDQRRARSTVTQVVT